MEKSQILFIQGGGEGGYEADKKPVASLRKELSPGYELHYPEIKPDLAAPDFGWLHQIGFEISRMPDRFILTGHSFGASMILKWLSENNTAKTVTGIFLIATPFWRGDEDWIQGIKLGEDFAEQLPDEAPVFFYHAKDDEEVPFSHSEHYREKIPKATFREIDQGGHQFNDDLSLVAKDILDL